MVELDAAKYGGGGELLVEKGTLWRITRSYWFHFGSLISIIVLMLYGFSPVLSVFWATMLAIAVSYLRRDTALVPPKLVRALAEGTTGVLSIAATCATAGIIVGVTTLTGLAQRFADIIIGYAQGNLVLTALFSAAIVWVVGLAVPVTASYIMCAVIAAPALIKLGVPDYAAHMFIFYYAVLSEVSPPTALSPFAAAAITGGSPYRTTLQAWKYTMPAFLVPFVFVCDPIGVGLLLQVPKGGSWVDIVKVALETAAGIALLGFAFQGRFKRHQYAGGNGSLRRCGRAVRLPVHHRRGAEAADRARRGGLSAAARRPRHSRRFQRRPRRADRRRRHHDATRAAHSIGVARFGHVLTSTEDFPFPSPPLEGRGKATAA